MRKKLNIILKLSENTAEISQLSKTGELLKLHIG